MKSPLSFLDTMGGRIFALLFIGLVFAGAVGVNISALQRASALEELQNARAADRVSEFLKHEESAGVIPGVSVLAVKPTVESANAMLTRYLSEKLSDSASIEGFTAPLQVCFPDMVERTRPAAESPYWRMRPPSCWVARIETDAGAVKWLSVETPMTVVNTPSAFDPLYLGALFGAAALLAYIVARIASAPLRRLSRSAAELGDGIEGGRFDESGPLEVRSAAAALNRMQEKITSQIAERTQMLSAIAHDLQTPLTRIRLRLDHLERGEIYEKLLSDTDEMRQLVREGLDLAHDVMPDEKIVQIDLDSLVDSIVCDACESGAEIVFVERSNCDVWARPLALKRAIVNILNNAVRYGRDVEVRAEAIKGDMACIVVLDRGPGVPEDQLKMILEPFRRLADKRAASRGGTGLGLAIANRFAELNGGSLTLANRPGGGLRAELKVRATPFES